MRWALTLVPLLLLSGCLGSGTDPADDPRESSSDSVVDAAPRKGVVFFETDYQATPQEAVAFEVIVPDGAVQVSVEVSLSVTPTPVSAADVALTGCGGGRVDWNPGPNVIISVSVLGGSWREADICGEAKVGAQTLTLTAGAAPMTGRILLRADLPEE